MTEKINFRKKESQLKLKIHMKLRKIYNEYSLGELNFNLIPSIKKRADDDTKDYICYSCYKMAIDMDLSTDIGHQWGNGVIDPSSQSEDSMCDDCFKLELDEPNLSLHLLYPNLYADGFPILVSYFSLKLSILHDPLHLQFILYSPTLHQTLLVVFSSFFPQMPPLYIYLTSV
jgi:hypothetical protein